MGMETSAHRTRDGRYRRDEWVKIAEDIRVPGHYAALLSLAGSTPETTVQVEKDLPRTGASFAKHGFTLKPGEKTWHALRNILTAYAAHDPTTGYVQSMHFLCAFLLLAGLNEEDAFWVLNAVTTKIVPGYFSEGMAATKLDQRVFLNLVHTHLPPIGLQLETIAPDNIVPAIISGQWLLTLFVNVLPVECTMLLWDRIFDFESRTPLFACALALLECAEENILGCDEMGACVELLQGLGESTFTNESNESELNASSVSNTSTPSNATIDTLIEKVDTYLSNELSVPNFTKEVQRELGRRGEASDAFLPPSVMKTHPPVTEIDELMDGVVSELSDVVSKENLQKSDAKAEAEEEQRKSEEDTKIRVAEREARRASRAERRREKLENSTTVENSGNISDDEFNASSGSNDDEWELTAGPKSIGMEWAEGLLAAGSSASMKTFAKTDNESKNPIEHLVGMEGKVDEAKRVFFATRFLSSSSNSEEGNNFDALVDAMDTTISTPGVSSIAGVSSLNAGVNPQQQRMETGRVMEGEAEVLSVISVAAKQVDTLIATLTAHTTSYKNVAQSTALRPVTVLTVAAPTLNAIRTQFSKDKQVLNEMMQVTQDTAAALSNGNEDAGLGWRPGAGVRDNGFANGGPDWNKWTDSVFEHVVQRANAVLSDLCHAVLVLERASKDLSDGGTDDDSNDPNDSQKNKVPSVLTSVEVSDALSQHGTILTEALRACKTHVTDVASHAKKDIPKLTENKQIVCDELTREASRSKIAIEKWSQAAETRRRRKTLAAASAMKEATDAAQKAFEAGSVEAAEAAVAPSTPVPHEKIQNQKSICETHDPESLTGLFALEDSQLDSALVSLATAQKTVTRRKNAVARERIAAEAVRAHAEKNAVWANSRVNRVTRVAGDCEELLKTRSDPELLQACKKVSQEIDKLGQVSRVLFAETVNIWRTWLKDSIATTALGYVVVVDAAAQRLDELLDKTAAKITERANFEKTNLKSNAGSILSGLLEDAVELIAPERMGRSATLSDSGETSDNKGTVGHESTAIEKESVDAESGSESGRRKSASFNPLRDRLQKTRSDLTSNLGDGMAKLSDAFQGIALGGFASRIGGKSSAVTAQGVKTETDETESRADEGSSASPAAQSSPSTGSEKPKTRDSRALLLARDDLNKLEARREALLEKKKWLRELLVSDERGDT